MTITINDIKLLKSQAMNDTDFGGGGPSGNQILDAVSNSIFPDITEVDRAAGGNTAVPALVDGSNARATLRQLSVPGVRDLLAAGEAPGEHPAVDR